MFLSSPAMADTLCWVTVTNENFETEVIEASKNKPVIVILGSEPNSEERVSDFYLIETQAKAQKFYGNGYKVIVGRVEKNGQIYDRTNIIRVESYSTPPIILGAKNGKLTIGSLFVDESDFEVTKNLLNNLS